MGALPTGAKEDAPQARTQVVLARTSTQTLLQWADGTAGSLTLLVPLQAGNGAGSLPGNVLDVITQYRGLSWR